MQGSIPPLRLLILGINFEPERTGIAPYTTALAHHLSEDHDVTVLTGVPHYPDWDVPLEHRHWHSEDLRGRLRVLRLRHFVPRKSSAWGRAAYELSYAGHAAAVGARIPADAVISVVPPLFGVQVARMIAHQQGIPYGVIVQDIMGSAAAQGGVRGGRSVSKLASAIESSGLHAADAVATIHPRMAAEVGRLGDRVTTPSVIYNWTHVRAATASRQAARDRFGWRDGEVIALHSGNMGKKQNLEVVVDAGRSADSSRSSVRMILAGGGSQRSCLEKYAAGCPKVNFLDGVEERDYADLLASADVLVVNERPGMREMSLPSKLTSYLTAGRPVVAATDSGSATAEFVRATGAGVVIPSGDARALHNTIAELAANRSLAHRMGELGRRFAEQHLSPTQAMAKYDTWVDQLLTGTAAHRRADDRLLANHS